MNCIVSNLMKFLVGALMVFGLSGNAAVAFHEIPENGCDSNHSVLTFSSSLGSTTSCADHNLSGCVVGSGETNCTYPAPGDSGPCSFAVSVPDGVGTNDSTTYTVTGDCQVRMAITQGNQGASYCGYLYPLGLTPDDGDTLITYSSRDTAVSHKQLEVCTDGLDLGETLPVVNIEKRVVRVLGGVVDCADPENLPTDELYAIAPTDVAYCYTISNSGGSTITDLMIEDDLGTANGDDDISLSGVVGLEPLPGGDTREVNSGVVHLSTEPCPPPSSPTSPPYCVEVTSAEELVNTATVTGKYPGCGSNCEDSDTATVHIEAECDTITQGQATTTGSVVTTQSLKGKKRCPPKQNNDTNVINSGSLLCDGSCEVRPECVTPPMGGSLPSHCAQPCKPSGNWTYVDEDDHTICNLVVPSPGQLPLCPEVLTNPGNGHCDEITPPALVRSDGQSSAYRRNPLLYYFPSSGGGNSVGTIYCILLEGDTAGDCPAGSIIY